MDKVSTTDMYMYIDHDSEWAEILCDLINGDYTIEALRQDFSEWVEKEVK